MSRPAPSAAQGTRGLRGLPLILLSAALVALAAHAGPLYRSGDLQPWPALCYSAAALGIVYSLADLLLAAARLVEWWGSRSPTGRSGSASWARWRQLKRSVSKTHQGPFWGRLAARRKSLFIDFASNAMCIAPAGSGKGIFTVIPNILAIRASKVVADFKGELVCVCAKALRQRGEVIRVLNPGGLWAERIGSNDCYSPLDIIVDDLHRPGGLRDVTDDLREMSHQLYPEPGEGDGENTYFRNGSRRAIADAMLIEAMIEGYDATLASVALLIEDRQAFEYHMRWIVGIDLKDQPLEEGPLAIETMPWAVHHSAEDVAAFSQLLRARANNWLALMSGMDRRTFDSFASGAQQALAPFAFGRLAPAMRRSTFSMSDLKDAPTTLFIVNDASRPEVYKAYTGLMQWCAMTAMKRHPAKDTPVYYILDEATNYIIDGLASLLTWGRSYGLRLLLVFQDLSAFEKAYGEKVLETLLSETEIKLFLPGQRSPKTLELIKKLLGEQSVISASTGGRDPEERLSEQLSESPRPLMTEDEIRRSARALLIVRRHPAALIEPVSYAAIHPWRRQAAINPFHGKPFLRPVALRLKEPRR
ncbi:MAG: type IV secretory system conjugative DNA transfer family protein [Wenzhouxiangellaceae bacterium]